jgi:integrase
MRVGKDPRTGKWIRRAATCSSEAEARRVERRVLAEAEIQRARFVQPTRQTLAEYLAVWLQRKRAEERKPKILYDYARVVRALIVPALGKMPLQDLSPGMVQAWAWQDDLAPTPGAHGAAQASRAYRCLRSALSDAERLGLIPENPAKRARPALRTPRKREGFTLEEARAILAAAEGEGEAPLFAFIRYTGLRLGEALGLRWSDVDLEAGRVTVRHNRVLVGSRMVGGTPKRARSVRTLALLGGAIEALHRQKARQAEARLAAGEAWRDKDRVFSTRAGSGLIASNVNRTFRRIRVRAGVRNLPPHALRHATASILLAAGVPMAVGRSAKLWAQAACTAVLLSEETGGRRRRGLDFHRSAHGPCWESLVARSVRMARTPVKVQRIPGCWTWRPEMRRQADSTMPEPRGHPRWA